LHEANRKAYGSSVVPSTYTYLCFPTVSTIANETGCLTAANTTTSESKLRMEILQLTLTQLKS
jgi:hypothetical protein